MKTQSDDDVLMDSKDDILQALGIDISLDESTHRQELIRLYNNELKDGTSAQDISQLHEAVKSCIGILKHDWRDVTRSGCRQQLGTLYPDSRLKQLDEAIDVALRIWLMIDSRDDSVTGYPRHWQNDETLQQLVFGRFPLVGPHDSMDITHFPRYFRAVDLETITGIVIQWTTYLDEHLRFDDDNRTLKVFNNKAWLIAVLNSKASEDHATGQESLPSSIPCSDVGVPRKLLEETIKTLDLLFPPWHDRTVKFLDDLGEDFYQLPPIPRDLPRLREFLYWRERLSDVIVEFESPPRNWRYVWKDRRHPMTFWTFWIGLFISILTLLSTAIAAVALWVAVKQLQMSS